jgi:hypothetical protein
LVLSKYRRVLFSPTSSPCLHCFCLSGFVSMVVLRSLLVLALPCPGGGGGVCVCLAFDGWLALPCSGWL